MKNKVKRIAAMLGVILLVGLAVGSLVFSLLDFPGSKRLATGCLICAIFMPILIWIWIWCYGAFFGKRTIASVWPEEPVNEETEEELISEEELTAEALAAGNEVNTDNE